MKPSLPPKIELISSWSSWKSGNSFALSLNHFIVAALIFILVFSKIQSTTCTEQPQPLNFSVRKPMPKGIVGSGSCTPPKYFHVVLSTSCSGYTSFPIVNLPRQFEITELIMNAGNNLGSLKGGQFERANMSRLLLLNLRNCQIAEIKRGTFREGNGLQQLYLDYNKIEVLDPQVFTELANLKTLHLGHNPIKSFQVGSVFPPMMSLSDLDFNSCQLSVIPENTFGKLIKLRRLHLDSNRLRTLSWKMLTQLRALEFVKLANNSWHCDCHLKFLEDVLYELRTEIDGGWMDKCRGGSFNCPPEIEAYGFISKPDEQMKLRGDISFECTYSGYPPPKVKWLKDGNPIQLGTDSSSDKFGQNMTHEVVSRFDLDELERNIWFKEVLLLRHVTSSESGNYTCFIENEAGQMEKNIFFKFNKSKGDDNSCPSSHGGMNWWVWMLITIFGILFLVLLTIVIVLTRRIYGARKQDVVIDIEELNYIQEAISQQQEPNGINGANRVNMPLL